MTLKEGRVTMHDVGTYGGRNTYIGSHAWNTYANVLQDATTKERSTEK